MRDDKQKSPIVGIVERGGKGRVIAKATPNISGATLLGMVREYIMPKSTIFTDEYVSYDGIKHMKDKGYKHHRIKHSSKVYVMGDVHTNTVEGFWSLVKRGIGGVYHSVGQKYLQSYLDEYSFRYNRRDQGNLIFTSLLKRVAESASPRVSVPAQMTPAPTDAF